MCSPRGPHGRRRRRRRRRRRAPAVPAGHGGGHQNFGSHGHNQIDALGSLVRTHVKGSLYGIMALKTTAQERKRGGYNSSIYSGYGLRRSQQLMLLCTRARPRHTHLGSGARGRTRYTQSQRVRGQGRTLRCRNTHYIYRVVQVCIP